MPIFGPVQALAAVERLISFLSSYTFNQLPSLPFLRQVVIAMGGVCVESDISFHDRRWPLYFTPLSPCQRVWNGSTSEIKRSQQDRGTDEGIPRHFEEGAERLIMVSCRAALHDDCNGSSPADDRRPQPACERRASVLLRRPNRFHAQQRHVCHLEWGGDGTFRGQHQRSLGEPDPLRTCAAAQAAIEPAQHVRSPDFESCAAGARGQRIYRTRRQIMYQPFGPIFRQQRRPRRKLRTRKLPWLAIVMCLLPHLARADEPTDIGWQRTQWSKRASCLRSNGRRSPTRCRTAGEATLRKESSTQAHRIPA